MSVYLQIKEDVFYKSNALPEPGEHPYSYLKRLWDYFVKWGIDNYKKVLFLIQMTDSPIISDVVREKLKENNELYYKFYQDAIDQGIFKDIPVLALKLWIWNAMLTTINYIVKNEPESTDKEKEKISESMFECYLYGVRK